MNSTVIGLTFLLAAVVVLPLKERSSYLFLLTLFAAAVPRTIWVFDESTRPGVGIAAATLSVSSYDVVLMLAALWAFTQVPFRVWIPWCAPAVVALASSLLWIWPRTGAVLDGAFAYMVCLVAWIVGVGAGIGGESLKTQRRLALGILLFVSVELASASIQLITGAANQSRAEGTFAHPAFLGKYVLLLFVVLLPLTQSADRRTVRIANIAIIGGVVATAMTLSRANVVSVVGAVALWFIATVLYGGRRKGVLVAGITALLVALPFADQLLDRFVADAEGGDRPELFNAGINVIMDRMWDGTGPNNFVEYATAQEEVVARTGYPIHNSFLLAVAELGLVISVLFFLPLIRTIWVAVRYPDRVSNRRGPFANATLIIAGMTIFAGTSGWGFLQQPTSIIMFLAFGVAYGRMSSARVPNVSLDPQVGYPRVQRRSAIGARHAGATP